MYIWKDREKHELYNVYAWNLLYAMVDVQRRPVKLKKFRNVVSLSTVYDRELTLNYVRTKKVRDDIVEETKNVESQLDVRVSPPFPSSSRLPLT